jgi:hypothetical protein
MENRAGATQANGARTIRTGEYSTVKNGHFGIWTNANQRGFGLNTDTDAKEDGGLLWARPWKGTANLEEKFSWTGITAN